MGGDCADAGGGEGEEKGSRGWKVGREMVVVVRETNVLANVEGQITV